MLHLLQPWLPPLLALAAVVAFDRAEARRGLRPPGFANPVRRVLFLVFFTLTSLRNTMLTSPPCTPRVRP